MNSGEPEQPLPKPLLVLGVVAVVMVAALTALLCVLLSPTRLGTTLVPVGIVLAVAMGAWLPRLAYRMSGSMPVAILTVLVFFLSSFAPTIAPGGDVLLPGGSTAQTLISYGTILAGAVAGGISIARM